MSWSLQAGWPTLVLGFSLFLSGTHFARAEPLRDIFDVIERLEQKHPFVREAVEEALQVKLRRNETADYNDFVGEGPKFADGMEITKIDLRQRRKNERLWGFLIVDVSGACRSKDSVSARFGTLDIFEIPRRGPRHGNPQWIALSAKRSWGKVVFTFDSIERTACLTSLSFHDDIANQ